MICSQGFVLEITSYSHTATDVLSLRIVNTCLLTPLLQPYPSTQRFNFDPVHPVSPPHLPLHLLAAFMQSPKIILDTFLPNLNILLCTVLRLPFLAPNTPENSEESLQSTLPLSVCQWKPAALHPKTEWGFSFHLSVHSFSRCFFHAYSMRSSVLL